MEKAWWPARHAGDCDQPQHSAERHRFRQTHALDIRTTKQSRQPLEPSTDIAPSSLQGCSHFCFLPCYGPLPERRHIIPVISVAGLSQPQRVCQDNKTSPVRIRTELLSPALIALDLQDDYIDRKQLDGNPYTSLKNSAGIPLSLKHVP